MANSITATKQFRNSLPNVFVGVIEWQDDSDLFMICGPTAEIVRAKLAEELRSSEKVCRDGGECLQFAAGAAPEEDIEEARTHCTWATVERVVFEADDTDLYPFGDLTPCTVCLAPMGRERHEEGGDVLHVDCGREGSAAALHSAQPES